MRHRPMLLAALLVVASTLSGCASLMATWAASGVLAAVALPGFVGMQDRARTAITSSAAKRVQLAFEMYAADRDGHYPPAADWLGTLQHAGAYLPENQLAACAYGRKGVRQANVLVAAPPLAKAGQPPTPVGTVLGPGHPPEGPTFDQTTFGAIVADVTPDGTTYVVYAIGKRGPDAVVAAALPLP